MSDNLRQERILIVDDDLQIQQLLTRYLLEQGYAVAAVGDGRAMDDWLEQHPVDLVILDLMLPGEDGLSLARRIRHRAATPIIMLSARGEEMDRIIGLEVGADDYLAKPFNPRELLARIRAVLRRRGTRTADQGAGAADGGADTAMQPTGALVRFGDFVLDVENRVLRQGDREVDLTSGEMSLLIIFATHPRRVLNRDRLIDMLKGGDADPFDRSIDVRVTRLRRKLHDNGHKPRYIRTVWGEGYRFTPDEDRHG